MVAEPNPGLVTVTLAVPSARIFSPIVEMAVFAGITTFVVAKTLGVSDVKVTVVGVTLAGIPTTTGAICPGSPPAVHGTLIGVGTA